MFSLRIAALCFAVLCCCICGRSAFGMERILLANGFSVDCHHREQAAEGRIRLYLDDGQSNYMEVEASKIVSTETVPSAITAGPVLSTLPAAHAVPSSASLQSMIANVGVAHNVNVALLESVVQEESGGHPGAVSRTGARGLMQLMPATARSLGVSDSFAPEQNLRGGTTYLDQLLTRYHDNLPLALAAYNAGPAAVDRYRGIPPYRETQLYVARIIREFNRRTLLAERVGTGEKTAR